MKLLIKLDDKYAEIFNVFFRKSRLRSVIGEMLLFDHMQALIPEGIKFHSHFTYFEDGNYHFSIKYFDTAESLYVDRNTYHNQIATRKNTGPDFKKENEVSYERRDKDPKDLLDMFMRGEPSKPWSNGPLYHIFSGFSMHSDGDYETKFEWDDRIKPNAEDLVIDYKDYKDHTINFNVVLYSKGHPNGTVSPDHIFPHYQEKIIENNGMIIKFSMSTTFNPSEKKT